MGHHRVAPSIIVRPRIACDPHLNFRLLRGLALVCLSLPYGLVAYFRKNQVPASVWNQDSNGSIARMAIQLDPSIVQTRADALAAARRHCFEEAGRQHVAPVRHLRNAGGRWQVGRFCPLSTEACEGQFIPLAILRQELCCIPSTAVSSCILHIKWAW